jgi:hypothetical protein
MERRSIAAPLEDKSRAPTCIVAKMTARRPARIGWNQCPSCCALCTPEDSCVVILRSPPAGICCPRAAKDLRAVSNVQRGGAGQISILAMTRAAANARRQTVARRIWCRHRRRRGPAPARSTLLCYSGGPAAGTTDNRASAASASPIGLSPTFNVVRILYGTPGLPFLFMRSASV